MNYAVRIHEFLPTDVALDGTLLSSRSPQTLPIWISQIYPLLQFIPMLMAVGRVLMFTHILVVTCRISRELFVRGS